MARYKIYEQPSNGYRERVKDGFNWVVLLFGPLWYLFNSMVGRGIAWLVVAIIVSIPTVFIGGVIVWIIAGAKANKDKEKKFLREGWKFIGYEDDIFRQERELKQIQQ